MVGLVNRLVGGLEVPLRAFCWKARGVAERLALLSVSGKVKDCVVDIDYLLVVKFYILSNIPF